MARKPTPKPLHPLRVAEAMEAMNTAAFQFVSFVDTVRTFLDRPDLTPESAKALSEKLEKAVADFRAAMWPEEG